MFFLGRTSVKTQQPRRRDEELSQPPQEIILI